MENNFEYRSFKKRLLSMMRVDFRRIIHSRLFYIMLTICFVTPILILVMTTMMDGMETVNQQTGQVEIIEGFDNVWQIIGSVSSSGIESEAAMDMSLTSMCNINMLYFAISAFVCVFISEDFRSGYAKNLFTVRAAKSDYVISKTVVSVFGCALMVLLFFLGSLFGGAVSSLPFTMEGFSAANLVWCVISKMLIVCIFVPIYILMSVIAKQKSWLSILLSFGVGMFLFMMVPMLSPLDSTFMNVILCVVGGALFSIGLGAISNIVLKKTSLI